MRSLGARNRRTSGHPPARGSVATYIRRLSEVRGFERYAIPGLLLSLDALAGTPSFEHEPVGSFSLEGPERRRAFRRGGGTRPRVRPRARISATRRART